MSASCSRALVAAVARRAWTIRAESGRKLATAAARNAKTERPADGASLGRGGAQLKMNTDQLEYRRFD